MSLIAYNLGNLWRRLAHARADREVVANHLTAAATVKTGGRLIKHARYYRLLLECHLTRRLFGGMLRRIAALPSSAG